MRKGVVLVTVWGILLIITTLALVCIYLIRNQVYVAEHKIKRLEAYYLAKAAFIYAQDRLRNNINWTGETGFSITGDPNDPTADITVGSTITSPNNVLKGTKPITIIVSLK